MTNINDILDWVVWLAAAMMLLSFVIWIVTTAIFAHMRNKTASRNDEKRERLWKKQEVIIDRLGKMGL